MKKMILTFLILLLPGMASAAGGPSVPLDHADIDLANKQSLQRGARTFVNYCLSCHSAHFQRYSRMAADLGLSEQMVIDNLMFASEKIGDTMTIAMEKGYAKQAFSAVPPDLSLVARSRGADWLYTYMRGFYLDPSRPFGVNNTVFPSVGMPHVLWEMQGWQQAVYSTDEHGEQHMDGLELVEAGTQTTAEYDRTVRDLVAFLAYVGEPGQLERKRIGVYVLLFLAFFFVVTYYLKKEYWKDIH